MPGRVSFVLARPGTKSDGADEETETNSLAYSASLSSTAYYYGSIEN